VSDLPAIIASIFGTIFVSNILVIGRIGEWRLSDL